MGDRGKHNLIAVPGPNELHYESSNILRPDLPSLEICLPEISHILSASGIARDSEIR